MKISKAQQEIIDLMRQGNTLHVSIGLRANVCIRKGYQPIKHLSYATFNALLKANIISFKELKMSDRENIYILTNNE